LYSDIWTRRHCKVIVAGREHAKAVRNRPRIITGPHPTTYDVPLLIHASKPPLSFIIAEGPYVHPIVGRLFDCAGFVKLNYSNPREAIHKAEQQVRDKIPMICSMYGYGSDFGEDVPPETGAIRMAHHAKADLLPIILMIDDDQRIFKWYRDSKGTLYPYTYLSDTYFFILITKPLLYEEYSKNLDTPSVKKKNAEYARIAQELHERYKAVIQAQKKDLVERADYYRSLKTTGGIDERIDW
jgi:1-acyl-sn-glycerol-3-phosphate acyltransferase